MDLDHKNYLILIVVILIAILGVTALRINHTQIQSTRNLSIVQID